MIEGLEELDESDWSRWSADATRLGYDEAYRHARGILDAATRSMITGYWTMRKVPAERGPMIAAIAGKMRAEERRIHPDVVGLAVDDVLDGREARRGLA